MESVLKTPNVKIVEWILRIAVFGEFLGHGVLALQVNPKFIALIEGMSGITGKAAEDLLVSIGIIDILTAVLAIVFSISIITFVGICMGIFNSTSKTSSRRACMGLC